MHRPTVDSAQPEQSGVAVDAALHAVLRRLPALVDAPVGTPIAGAAVCMLTSDGQARLAVTDEQPLIPAALMLATSLIGDLDGKELDPRVQALLAKSRRMLDYAIQLKRGDVFVREGVH